MASRKARTSRGHESEHIIAERYRDLHGFKYALAVGGSRPGVDITGVDGLAIEVKARADWSPLAWVRQANRTQREGLPFVISRQNGQGPQNVEDWIVLMSVKHHEQLLREAGRIP